MFNNNDPRIPKSLTLVLGFATESIDYLCERQDKPDWFDVGFGLCTNLGEYLYSLGMDGKFELDAHDTFGSCVKTWPLHSGFKYHPINDTKSQLDVYFQFNILPHYTGTQLLLRIKLLQHVIYTLNLEVKRLLKEGK